MFSSSAGSLCSNKNNEEIKKIEDEYLKKSQNEMTFGDLGTHDLDKD